MCLASGIFSLINYLVRSCWCFSTELGFPLKVLKNESAVPSITKYFLVSTRWLFYFQFWILIMKGVKSCSGLSGFSLRSHHICREKKKISVIAGKSGFYQPVLRRASIYLLFVSFTCVTWIFSTDPRFKVFKEHGIHSFQNDEKLSS